VALLLPLERHYCCPFGVTTDARGSIRGRRIAFEARTKVLFPEFIPGGWNKGVGEGEIE